MYTPKKEMRYKYQHKINRFKVEIVHNLVIMSAMTQNHSNRQQIVKNEKFATTYTGWPKKASHCQMITKSY